MDSTQDLTEKENKSKRRKWNEMRYSIYIAWKWRSLYKYFLSYVRKHLCEIKGRSINKTERERGPLTKEYE